MKKLNNCIQQKIDQLIENATTKKDNKNNQEVNEVACLISYSHCLDLFEFLRIYSRIQKNELLFQMAFIYEILGYYDLSLKYIDESLTIIPNVPTIILFKSCLYATMNEMDEAQKFLLKYKYLIGEDSYYNYLYNSIRILYFYLCEYEENIILREIDITVNKYQNYYENNVILFFIKSKILFKLSEKFKRIDKNRSIVYEKESIKYKDKILNNKIINVEYLYKVDIYNQNILKILTLIFPNFKEYKPKALTNYNSNFHNGFGVFFTLLKICKLFKCKIEIIKYKKRNNNKYKSNKSSKRNSFNENNNFDKSLNIIKYSHDMMKEFQESVISISKSPWITNYISNSNNNETNKESNNSSFNKRKNKIQKLIVSQNNSIKEKNNNDINNKIKANYYIYNGYYSNLNLKENILNNINLNNKYKEKILGKDSLLDGMNEDFQNNIKINKSDDDLMSIKKYNFFEDNEKNMINKKIIRNQNNEKSKKKYFNIKLVKSTQNSCRNKNNKNKIIKLDVEYSKSKYIDNKSKKNSLKKEKESKDKEKKITKNVSTNFKILDDINNHINNNFVKNNSKMVNSIKKYASSYKNLINSNENLSKKQIKKNEEQRLLYKNDKANFINNYHSGTKQENKNNKKIQKIKKYVKNLKNTNSIINIFNNKIIFGSKFKCVSRNSTKTIINYNNNKKITEQCNNKNNLQTESNKEKELAIVNELEKNKETYNDMNDNNNVINEIMKYKFDNNNQLLTYQINNKNNINYDTQSVKQRNINIGSNRKMMDIGNYYYRKIDISKRKKLKIMEEINESQKFDNKIHKNTDNIIYNKSSTYQNNKNQNRIKNIPKYLQKSIKGDLTLEKSPYNTINLIEFVKRKHSTINKKNINYIKYENMNKILNNNNIHNKNKTNLEYKTRKENPKSEKKKKSQYSVKEKANYLTINLDELTKSKVYTPIYSKISLFGSFHSNSKEQKKENVKKIGFTKKIVKSPKNVIRLTRIFTTTNQK